MSIRFEKGGIYSKYVHKFFHPIWFWIIFSKKVIESRHREVAFDLSNTEFFGLEIFSEVETAR